MTSPVIDTDLSEIIFVPTEGVDFKLDYCGLVGNKEAWRWISCGPTFSDNYSSHEPFNSQAAAVDDATTVLSNIYNEPADFSALEAVTVPLNITLADSSPYKCGVHFVLYACEGEAGVYWQGLCQEPGESAQWWSKADFSEHASNHGYFSERYAAADAIYCFHRLRKHDAVSSLTLCYELGLPVEQILEEHFIRLTVSQASGYGSVDDDVEAMSLEAKREVLIDRTKADVFIAECHSWESIAFTYEDGTTFTNAERYQEGYGVVIRMDTADWAKWLVGYETIEEVQLEQAAASLSG